MNQGIMNGTSPGSKKWNVCYANSMLQALAPVLYEWSLHTHMSNQYKTRTLTTDLAWFLYALRQKQGPLDPSFILKYFPRKYPLGEQHEIDDFFNTLLNTADDPDLTAQFMIQHRSMLQCTTCGHTLHQGETWDSKRLYTTSMSLYFDLTLAHNTSISFSDLLQRNSAPEEREFTCSYPGKHPQKKRGGIFHSVSLLLPPVHIVRVLLNRVRPRESTKTFHRVHLRETENFNLYQKDPNRPRQTIRKTLWSVVVHQGASSHGGHYYTFAKHPVTKQWFKFDDDKVTPSSFKEIQEANRSVFLLFFK